MGNKNLGLQDDQPVWNLIFGIFDRAVQDLEDDDPVKAADAWLFILTDQFWYEAAGFDRSYFLDRVMEG
jgi:hypothetical protein